MRHRPLCVLLATCLLPLRLAAQYSIGVQGGPFFFQGAWEAKQELSNTSGWMAGIQVVEGRTGKSGFRVGLDIGQRAYTLRAMNDDNQREEFNSTSTMLWLSFEMRWSLSRKHRIFFELGPVIGMEVHEKRTGVRFYEGEDYFGMVWRTDSIPATETESGFAIRDGHWRIGVSAELPLAGRWLFTSGAHICPGVGSWARGHGYATIDATLRAGFLYRLRS
jgi:Outer membrane protein beta-barrel domain